MPTSKFSSAFSIQHSAFLLVVFVTFGCGAAKPPSTPHASSSAVIQLRKDLDHTFGAAIMARGVWGVEVRSLDKAEVLYERDPGRLMMPASNMKIVTLAVAADVLGWDHRFVTTLETYAPIEGGVLKGDLFVRGGGDPSINSRDGRAAAVVSQWIAALRAAGVERIDGRIIGDDQTFDDEGIGPGWAWDYLQYGYAAPVGALEFNEDLAQLTIAPGRQPGTPADVKLSAGSGLRLVNRVTTLAADSPGEVDYRRRLDEPVLEVFGGIAAGSAPIDRSVAVVNPTVFFAQSLKDALVQAGIDVGGPPVDLDDVAAQFAGTSAGTGERRVIASTPSPPLREIGTTMMKVSQNLYAETLLKAIGAARGGLGTYEGGLTAVRAKLHEWDIPDDGYVIADGSGLSRYNYLAPATIAAILEREYKDERSREPFVATLPIAGKDGTISTRLRRTRAEGNAVAKTGSISNARSLSGYVRTRDGEMLVFSIMANDFVIPAATVNFIADVGVEYLANFTRR